MWQGVLSGLWPPPHGLHFPIFDIDYYSWCIQLEHSFAGITAWAFPCRCMEGRAAIPSNMTKNRNLTFFDYSDPDVNIFKNSRGVKRQFPLKLSPGCRLIANISCWIKSDSPHVEHPPNHLRIFPPQTSLRNIQLDFVHLVSQFWSASHGLSVWGLPLWQCS